MNLYAVLMLVGVLLVDIYVILRMSKKSKYGMTTDEEFREHIFRQYRDRP